MAAAGGAGAEAASAGPPNRINIRTVSPLQPVIIGMNKNQPIYVLSLRGTGRDPRQTYDDIMKILPKRVDSNKEMCVGLSKPFTKKSAETSNLIFALMGDVFTVGMYGFATVKVYKIGAEEKKYFEIDVFCTKQSFKGIGKRIMDEIKKIALNPENSITSIVLKSTPGAIGFYASQGFRQYDMTPDRAGLTRMYLNINGSEEESWKTVPGFSGDRIVPAEPAPAAAAAPAPAPAPAPALPAAPSAGGARRTKRRSKGKRKYTHKHRK